MKYYRPYDYANDYFSNLTDYLLYIYIYIHIYISYIYISYIYHIYIHIYHIYIYIYISHREREREGEIYKHITNMRYTKSHRIIQKNTMIILH